MSSLPHRVALDFDIDPTLLAEIVDLCRVAPRLAANGKRSPGMVEQLRLSLTDFCENRLPIIQKPFPPKRKALSGKRLFSKLSTPLENAVTNPLLARYCRRVGAVYVGELYLVASEPRSKVSRLIKSFLVEQLALSATLDPLKTGWRPPYWDNQKFRELLDASLWSLFEGKSDPTSPSWKLWEKLYENGTFRLGDLLGKGKRMRASWLHYWQREFQKAKLGVHAAAIVPPDWQSPPNPPQEWLDYRRLLDWGIDMDG